jgi:hypothetical protein
MILINKIPLYITFICLFIPIIQVNIDYNLNRFILLFSALLYLASNNIPKIKFNMSFLIIIIVGFIIIGFIDSNTFTYSASIVPLLYGLIFYMYLNTNIVININFYYYHIFVIYKILLTFMFIELLFTLFYSELLFELFSSNSNTIVSGYTGVTSKFIQMLNLNIGGLNSLYFGPQAASSISIAGLVCFYPYDKNFNNKKWYIISLFFFVITFTFTTLIMFFMWLLMTIIFFPKCRRIFVIIMLISLPICAVIYERYMSHITINGHTLELVYYNSFVEIINAFINLPVNYQLFGIPHTDQITEYTSTFEFHYMLSMFRNGALFSSITVGINIYYLIKASLGKYKHNHLVLINLMVITIWHASLIHYGLMKTGPNQLWGLHIAIFILFTQHSKAFYYQNFRLLSTKNIIPT